MSFGLDSGLPTLPVLSSDHGSKRNFKSPDHRSLAGYGGYVNVLQLSALFLFSGWVSIRLTPVWHCY